MTDEELSVGWCGFCERDVLAVPDPDDPGLRRCAHCDERLRTLRPIAESELESLGYEFFSGDAPTSGCTSCASGGCGIPRRATH